MPGGMDDLQLAVARLHCLPAAQAYVEAARLG